MGKEQGHLPRLSGGAYQGLASVHWVHTVEDRKTGWLGEDFHGRFREILLHCMAKFRLCCAVYCLMPDHVHMVWIGWHSGSDQRRASAFFRRHANAALLRGNPGARFQRQAYDHVLREEERRPDVFESTVGYIAANPLRAGIVAEDQVAEFPYAGCMVPGYPDLSIWDAGYWQKFWRIYEALVRQGAEEGM